MDITVNIENAIDANGKIYIVEGEPLTVSCIDVESLNGKAAGISGLNYVLGHVGSGYTIVQPFGGTISANLLPAGNHLLTIAFDVLQMDKSIAYAQLSTVVTVAPSAEDLPDGTTLGNVALTYHLNPQN